MLSFLLVTIVAQADVSARMYSGQAQGQLCNYAWTGEMPMRVKADDTFSKRDLAILHEAVKDFNRAIGLELLVVSTDGGISLTQAPRIAPGKAGVTKLYSKLGSCYIASADISILKNLEKSVMKAVLVHEFGHAFGLLHMEDCSYMSETVEQMCKEFSEHHRYMLEILYSGRSKRYVSEP